MTIELYIIRHGIAADREAYATDEERPLTEKGHQKTGEVAKQLRERKLDFDRLLSSPLVRAHQTAAILQEAGLAAEVQKFPALAPDGNMRTWVSWFEEWRQEASGEGTLALVGHQPDLANWAQMLVWGEARENLVLKKAGVIGLTLPKTGTPIGHSSLFLLTSPKWLL